MLNMGEIQQKGKQVIMEAKFRAVLMNGESFEPYLLGDKGYADIGGFEVRVPGYKELIPFDFEATVKRCNEDGTFSFGNWDGLAFREFDVDPCHEDDWVENGLRKEDITARLLASAEKLNDFYFAVYDMEDNSIPCFLEVLEMNFTDEKNMCYSILPEVLKEYNRQRVAEQAAEFIRESNHLPYDATVRQRVEESYLEKLKSKESAGILAVIDSIQKIRFDTNTIRKEGEFLIDCMLEVAASKNNIYRVGLAAYGNPDHGENPDKPIPGVDMKYVYCDSIEACQEAVNSYIREHDLGGGNWCGGMLYQGGKYAGRISYNGRFWDKTSEYGSMKSLKKTELPGIDASICSYGKNLFLKETFKQEVSLDAKMKQANKKNK